jgi:hypothetical protein
MFYLALLSVFASSLPALRVAPGPTQSLDYPRRRL